MIYRSSRRVHSDPAQKQRRFRRRLRRLRGDGRRRIPRAAVPSFFTLMNLFCGFLAIVQVADARFDYAAWLIVLAAFFDMLDGMMARLTNGQSLFGVELDSLADIVSFGIAPSFMIYSFGLSEHGVPGIIVSSLPAICGAVRLARFNVEFEGEKKPWFSGLPIPVAAMVIVAIIVNGDRLEFLTPGNGSASFYFMSVILLSVLMVSTIRFDAVPRPSAAYVRHNRAGAVLYLLAVILLITLLELGLLIVLGGYLAIGIGRAGRSFFRSILSDDPDEPDE
ncbi:MAG: CDP-diacylglycerol--serine O-phosphatidyltransferase [Rhodothermales bacterium]|nr:CDP-diacylglycerol--serine O-phosphatidyltransferase [Rhodothermales bacterium]